MLAHHLSALILNATFVAFALSDVSFVPRHGCTEACPTTAYLPAYLQAVGENFSAGQVLRVCFPGSLGWKQRRCVCLLTSCLYITYARHSGALNNTQRVKCG